MNQESIGYLKSQRIGVLAVEMPDGAPHAATIHYAFSEQTGKIYILTERESKKCAAVIQNGQARASFVIGTNEAEMKTLQADGTIALAEKDSYHWYFDVLPDKQQWFKEPQTVILAFTPTWWRYTDMKAPKGEQIVSSDNI